MSSSMLVQDLGRVGYREAWLLQEEAHAQVLTGGPGSEERLLLVEHPPVITLGRRPGLDRNLLTPPHVLARLGVELVQSDRGGDITFHGPGQLVAYPIVRLLDHALSVGAYVRALERAVIATLTDFGLRGLPGDQVGGAIGVWVEDDTGTLAKVCAVGVRIKRGVSLHGLALNVETDLSYFELIVPCGLPGRPVTSLRNLLGGRTPTIDQVKPVLARRLRESLDATRTPRTAACGRSE